MEYIIDLYKNEIQLRNQNYETNYERTRKKFKWERIQNEAYRQEKWNAFLIFDITLLCV